MKFSGASLSLAYAMLFNEWRMPILDFDNPATNVIGGFFVPFVNLMANMLTGLDHSDWRLGLSYDVYPGHETCKHE